MHKHQVEVLQKNIQTAKTEYSLALKNLEGISEEIHEMRKSRDNLDTLLSERQEGVGAESLASDSTHDLTRELVKGRGKKDIFGFKIAIVRTHLPPKVPVGEEFSEIIENVLHPPDVKRVWPDMKEATVGVARSGVAGARTEVAGASTEVAATRPEVAGARPEMEGAKQEMVAAGLEVGGAMPEVAGDKQNIGGGRPEMEAASWDVGATTSGVAGAGPELDGAMPEMEGAKQEVSGARAELAGVKEDLFGEETPEEWTNSKDSIPSQSTDLSRSCVAEAVQDVTLECETVTCNVYKTQRKENFDRDGEEDSNSDHSQSRTKDVQIAASSENDDNIVQASFDRETSLEVQCFIAEEQEQGLKHVEA